MYNILICDDEKDIVSALKIYLGAEGFKTFEAYNGEQALNVISENEIHLVLLDIMMPIMDGLTAMVKIREISNVPIILLTAKGEDTDKVLGLTVGADDYVTKPFNPVEVIARVKSQIRRYMRLGAAGNPAPGTAAIINSGAQNSAMTGNGVSGDLGNGNAKGVLQNAAYSSGNNLNRPILCIGGIELDDKAKLVTVEGKKVNLTPTEYELLKLFMENPGIVFSLKEIYGRVWNEVAFGQESTVAVHIRHLREKIEINPAEPRYLKVVWGQGYKIDKG